VVARNRNDGEPVAPQLAKLATKWDISLRTAWTYYRRFLGGKTIFAMRSAHEIANERLATKLFQSMYLEVEIMARDAIQKVFQVAGDLYPSEAPEVAERISDIYRLGYDLLRASPSRAHDIRCKIEAIAAEIEVAAAAAWDRRKRAANVADFAMERLTDNA